MKTYSVTSCVTLLLCVAFASCKVERAKKTTGTNPANTTSSSPGSEKSSPANNNALAKIAASPITTTRALPPGDALCSAGGVLIETYTDINHDGKYEESVDKDLKANPVCNGQKGAAVIQTSSLLPGDARCQTGGTLIVTFTDVDENSIYNSSIDKNYKENLACNGNQGPQGSQAMVASREIPAQDVTCPSGGLAIDSFVDTDGDSIYTAGKDAFLKTAVLCKTAAQRMTMEPLAKNSDADCPAGGTRISSFVDSNANGVFDSADSGLVQRKICEGSNGAMAVVQTEVVQKGDSECKTGGILLRTFTDIDGNNTFTQGTDVSYPDRKVCNGLDHAALATTRPVAVGDSTCPDGGVLIVTYIDLNDNFQIDSSDSVLASNNKVCSGRTVYGFNAVVQNFPIAANDPVCPSGGTLYKTSTDINKNGAADPADYDFRISKVCNGSAGNSVLPPSTPPNTPPDPNLCNLAVTESKALAPGHLVCFQGGSRTLEAKDSNCNGMPDISDTEFKETLACAPMGGNSAPTLTYETNSMGCGTSGGLKVTGKYNASASNSTSTECHPSAISSQTEIVPVASPPAPSPRFGHSAVWTGDKMIVWGGRDFATNPLKGDGGIFDPVAKKWQEIPQNGDSPSPRTGQFALWTGDKMLIFGGEDAGGKLQWNAALFDPATNKWEKANGAATGTASQFPLASNILNARYNASVTFTNGELLVWGGSQSQAGGNEMKDGAAFNIATKTWRKLDVPPPPPTDPNITPAPRPAAPGSRHWASAINNGTQTFIYGGRRGTIQGGTVTSYSYYNDIGIYNTVPDDIYSTTKSNACAFVGSGLARHGAVWANGRMITQGGIVEDGQNTQSWAGRPYPWLLNFDMLTFQCGLPISQPKGLIGVSSPSFFDSGKVIMPLAEDAQSPTKRWGAFDLATQIWTTTANLTGEAGNSAQSVVRAGQKILAFGGINEKSILTNAVTEIELP